MAKITRNTQCYLYNRTSDCAKECANFVGHLIRTDTTSIGYPAAVTYLGELYSFRRADKHGVHYVKDVLGYFIPDVTTMTVTFPAFSP